MVFKKLSGMWKKSVCALLLCAMTFTTIGTNVSEVQAAMTEEIKTDSQLFDEFTKELFKEAISGDLITNNLNIIDSSKYGVYTSEIPVTSSGVMEDELKASIEGKREILRTLRTIRYANLTEEQKDLYDLLMYEIHPDEDEKFMYYDKAFGSYSGIQTNIITSLLAYTFDERQDFVDYLRLVGSIPQTIKEAVDYEAKRSELGLFMSDNELDEVIVSLQALIADSENSVLVTAFNHTVDSFGLNNRDQVRFKKQNHDIVVNEILPAFATAIDGLNALRGTGIAPDQGLCALPEGREYYEYLLREYSGTERSPLEYIQIFDDLSEQYLAEMEQITSQANLFNFYGPSAKYVTGTPEDYLALLKENSKEYFTELTDIEFQIKYVDEALGTFAAPAYVYVPQVDATGTFNVNINPAYETSASIDTVSHEAYPGHLYQFVTMIQDDKNPLYNLYNNYGFIEGWANHVQSMAYYFTDASPMYARYMQLAISYSNFQLYKLDILVNYMGYSKKAAIEYCMELGADADYAEMIYNHFLSVPAYNMCYAAGQAEVELMANKAQETLGTKFDYKEFHNFLLKHAECTFETINNHFENWLVEQQ